MPAVDMKGGTAALRSHHGFVGSEVQDGPPKTARSRRGVSLAPEVMAVLRQHRVRQNEERLHAGSAWQGAGYTFTLEDGRPLRPDWVTAQFRRQVAALSAAEKVEHAITLHGLRHTWATLALQHGVHPKTVADQLGDTVEMVLTVYSHVIPSLGREATAAITTAIMPP